MSSDESDRVAAIHWLRLRGEGVDPPTVAEGEAMCKEIARGAHGALRAEFSAPGDLGRRAKVFGTVREGHDVLGVNRVTWNRLQALLSNVRHQPRIPIYENLTRWALTGLVQLGRGGGRILPPMFSEGELLMN